MIFLNLIDSIPELLYKHNCVIIPGFGGFITNFKHSGFEESRNLISPSCKKVAFNQSLIENDGLLVNYWAQTKGITYKDSLMEVETFKEFLKERIFQNKSFDFKNIGTFYLNPENNIIFVPYQGLNFLESSFGLYPVKIKSIQAYSSLSIEYKKEEAKPKMHFAIANKNETDFIHKQKRKTYYLNNQFLLKTASLIFLSAASVLSIYYVLRQNKKTEIAKQDSTEQHASIINLDTNADKVLIKDNRSIAKFEYTNERKKMLAIKTQLDSYSEKYLPKNESYNVIIGYFTSQQLTKNILNSLKSEYPSANLCEKTEAGYSIIVENFYKHTTAKSFSVLLKQNGYKNIKIEKQVIFGK